MSVQPIETPAINLELIVGEMPDVPCEHATHEEDKGVHDNGPAKFYGRGVCPSCKHFGPVRAVCAAFAAYAVSDGPMVCLDCKFIGIAWQLTQILGPVK